MGRYRGGEIIPDEDHFGDMHAFNSLVIGGTIFPHMLIHKVTWISPDNVTENQIHHICISREAISIEDHSKVYEFIEV